MRYVVRPKMNWDDEHPMIEKSIVVDEPPVRTGLLNKDGEELYRLKDRIGFVRTD